MIVEITIVTGVLAAIAYLETHRQQLKTTQAALAKHAAETKTAIANMTTTVANKVVSEFNNAKTGIVATENKLISEVKSVL